MSALPLSSLGEGLLGALRAIGATLEETLRIRGARLVLAGLLGAAALAGIYPVAATIATAMANSLRMDEAQPAAPIIVSLPAAERHSLGLGSVRAAASVTALRL